MKRNTWGLLTLLGIGVLITSTSPLAAQSFRRVATFPVFQNTDINTQTVCEIVAASENGRTLIYTDSASEAIGFVDISNPASPAPAGFLPMGGEPTSVAVVGPFALVAVNTSADFVNTSGVLRVVHIASQTVVRNINLGGQPDSVAVSPDKRYAVVAIENERDEDLGDGEPPQSPPGYVVVVDLLGMPVLPIPYLWATRKVDLHGVPDLYPTDPEPEFVAINNKNIAAVTLQENNHIVLLDLDDLAPIRLLLPWFLNGAKIQKDWNAGTVNLSQIDTNENDLIEQVDSLSGVPREPDGVTWIGNKYIATADEGDLFGGSRGFTVYNTNGGIVFSSGNGIEHLAAAIGHYPEDRSENKGTEPESVVYGKYSAGEFLFVGTERSSFVAVYKLTGQGHQFHQVLPGGVGPEGLLAIPGRNLFVTASEEDERADTYRSSLTIYQLVNDVPNYPTIVSENRPSGVPIPWGALSALAADPDDAGTMYTAHDSFYAQSRLYAVDLTQDVPTIYDEIVLHNGANTVDYDIEGVCARADEDGGGFWVATEGDDSPPIPNRLLRVADDGTILFEIQLPASLQAERTNNGYEGVASVVDDGTEYVYVAIQREWKDDPQGLVKIGRYDVSTGQWTFAHYQLDAPTSPNGGWVGLSELVAVNSHQFAVIERDNQAGADARIKRVYGFDVNGATFLPHGSTLQVLAKSLIRDLVPDLEAPRGAIIEKVEGLAFTIDGDAWIVTDNDGVDGSNGETQFLNLGNIFGN